MKKLIDEIAVIPGVTGSCIFDRKSGPVCTDSTATLATDLLQTVGGYLVNMLKMGKGSGLDIASSHFRFDSCTVVGLPLDGETILLTVCDTQANCSLVATMAAMLAADMREDLQGEAGKVLAPKSLQPEPEAENVESLQADSYMQSYLEQFEDALASAIGPVAGMVIEDHITKWRQGGPAVPTRLNELTEMLVGEIDAPPLVEEFRNRVKRIV